MDVFDLILKIKQRHVIEFLNILFKDISCEVVDVLEYLCFESLDTFEDLIVLLGHIGF